MSPLCEQLLMHQVLQFLFPGFKQRRERAVFLNAAVNEDKAAANDLPAAEHFGEQTFLAALGIAGGMAIAWCLADLSRKLQGRL